MIKRYALMFLGVALIAMSLLLAISGVSLAWLTAFLGVGCVVMGIISIFSYKEIPETGSGVAEVEDTDDDKIEPEVRQEEQEKNISIENYRSRIAPDNIR